MKNTKRVVQNVKKDVFWNTLGSGINAFTSLFYMIIVTRINGVEDAGIFTFAFSFACMVQVIGTYAGRTYHVTDNSDYVNDSDYIYQRFITCILMFMFSVFFVLIKGYLVLKVAVILLLVIYKMLDSFSEVLYGVLQKNGKLYKVGKSLFVKSVGSVVLFLIVDYLFNNIIFAIMSLILTNILVILCYEIPNVKKCKIEKTKFDLTKIKKLFVGGFFVFIFTFLTQYVCNASKYAIDDLMKVEFQTIFGIILMPATFILLCSQLVIQPFLLSINNYIKNCDYKKVYWLVLRICLFIFVIGILGEICCYLVGIPFLNLVYSISLNKYLGSLLIIIAGAVFYGMSAVISACLIAMNKNFIQTIFYIIASIFAAISSYCLVLKLKIFGAALSYFFTMFILFILYFASFIYFCRRKSNEEKKYG